MNNILTSDSTVTQFVDKIDAHMKEINTKMSKTDDVKVHSLFRAELAAYTNIVQQLSKLKGIYLKQEKLNN
jgi:hypothetical protein